MRSNNGRMKCTEDASSELQSVSLTGNCLQSLGYPFNSLSIFLSIRNNTLSPPTRDSLKSRSREDSRDAIQSTDRSIRSKGAAFVLLVLALSPVGACWTTTSRLLCVAKTTCLIGKFHILICWCRVFVSLDPAGGECITIETKRNEHRWYSTTFLLSSVNGFHRHHFTCGSPAAWRVSLLVVVPK